MNAKCRISGHDWQKVYPDQELIDSIVFEQDIEEMAQAIEKVAAYYMGKQ